jgi:peptidyl-prolyl cis-trans isomerase B (cyclophilin B)
LIHRAALPCLLAALVLTGARPAAADEEFVAPTAAGLVLDGRVDEDAWAGAARLPAGRIDVVLPPPATGERAPLTPDVRLLTAAGWLHVAVRAEEDPGTAIGIHLVVADDDADSAAEAVSLGYRPVELRAPLYAVRGPRGVGRSHYRIEGAADTSRAGFWSIEARVPLADLVGADREAPVRMAVLVATRTPNLVTTAPAGALWSAPSSWIRLRPPAGGWALDAEVDTKRHEVEDRQDRARRTAWLDYLRGSSVPIQPHLTFERIERHMQELVIDPLVAVVEARPDLEVPVRVMLGDIQHRLGRDEEAARHFEAAIAQAPGWREAHFGLHIGVRARTLSEGPPGTASDYAARFARLDAMRAKKRLSPWARDGLDLAYGLLQYKRGQFYEATQRLEPLATRYPIVSFIDDRLLLARQGTPAVTAEERMRAADAEHGRPRATLRTAQGPVVIEMFQEQAPNTVNNFVWLGQKGFYDGLAFHRTVPFFMVQGGDPCTRPGNEAADDVLGSGTPGYAIRSEVNTRSPLRGAVCMAHAGRDTEGSQFFILTGTGLHLRGETVVFGRVVGGMEVVDAIRAGDRIEGVTFERLVADWSYRPTTLAGTEAPEPRDDWQGR